MPGARGAERVRFEKRGRPPGPHSCVFGVCGGARKIARVMRKRVFFIILRVEDGGVAVDGAHAALYRGVRGEGGEGGEEDADGKHARVARSRERDDDGGGRQRDAAGDPLRGFPHRRAKRRAPRLPRGGFGRSLAQR